MLAREFTFFLVGAMNGWVLLAGDENDNCIPPVLFPHVKGLNEHLSLIHKYPLGEHVGSNHRKL